MEGLAAASRLLLVLFFLSCLGRDMWAAAPDTTASRWDSELITRLSVSQIGFRNWNEGGLNTLSVGSAVDGKFAFEQDGWIQKHEVQLRLGAVKQDTLAFRKADDLIQLRSSFQVEGEGLFRRFNPIYAVSIRTQFAEGYNFKTNPFKDGRTPPVAVSSFASPATFTQSLGLTYDRNNWFVQRLGLGAKTTIVGDARYRPLYNLDPDQSARFEVGLEATTQFDREVFENVRYKSDLRIFSAIDQTAIPDVLWENLVAMKINAWLGVTFEYVALYDRDQTDLLQMKQNLSLGVSYTVL